MLLYNRAKIVLGDYNAMVGKQDMFVTSVEIFSSYKDISNNGKMMMDFAAAGNTAVSIT